MTPNETDTQVDAPNEVSTTTTPLEEISSNPNKDIDGGSIPSNILRSFNRIRTRRSNRPRRNSGRHD